MTYTDKFHILINVKRFPCHLELLLLTEALERQKQMYERQMWMLRNQLMSPGTPSTGYPPLFDPFTKFTPMGTNSGNNMHPKYQQWVQER